MMSIFHIKNDKMALLNPNSFKNQRITEREIQNIIKNNSDIEIFGEKLLIIGEELSPFEDSNKRLDLLALDTFGKLVVIELKRDDDGFHMDLQAIRYASMVRLFSIAKIIECHSNFHKCDNEQSEYEINEFLCGDYAQKLDFDNVRIILVNQDFSKDITNTVLWLNEQGLDIKCVKINPYELNGQIFWDIDTIIPVKEAQEYQLKLKEKKNSDQETKRQSNKDFSKYQFNGVSLGKGRLVLAVVTKYCKDNPDTNIDDLQKQFPKELQPSLEVVLPLSYLENHQNVMNRYFKNESDIITLNNGDKITVCTQWGIRNIENFIKKANKLGYQIDSIN